jgi:hypothetical protein
LSINASPSSFREKEIGCKRRQSYLLLPSPYPRLGLPLSRNSVTFAKVAEPVPLLVKEI